MVLHLNYVDCFESLVHVIGQYEHGKASKDVLLHPGGHGAVSFNRKSQQTPGLLAVGC